MLRRIALRCATALGVNISTHGFVECGIITDEIRQARDSVFHTATVQDSVRSFPFLPSLIANFLSLQLWSLAVGRYPSFRHAGQDIAPPEVRPEDDARPWLLPSIWEPLNPNAAPDTSGRTLHPHSNMPSLISTTFVATADLALIQSDLIHELCVAFPFPAASCGADLSHLSLSCRYWNKLTPSSPAHTAVVTSLGHRLESFAAGLPAELKVPHALLLASRFSIADRFRVHRSVTSSELLLPRTSSPSTSCFRKSSCSSTVLPSIDRTTKVRTRLFDVVVRRQIGSFSWSR